MAVTRVSPGRVGVGGLYLDPVTEREVAEHVLCALAEGRGGWIATPNLDISRQARADQTLARLLAAASLAVPDGMPLIWAASLQGTPLPERVTGSSLIYSLTEAASRASRTVYFLGGAPGIPEAAGRALSARYSGLKVAGAYAPPWGFDATAEGREMVLAKLTAATPDIVYVGLGFPRQEQLIAYLAPALPRTWFVACGAAIPFAAGALQRAPAWMQEAGLEWAHRLLTEPRRLFSRYVLHDVPFAARLIAGALIAGLRSAPARARRPERRISR